MAILGIAVPRQRALGVSMLLGGIAWTGVCALIIHAYAGATSPFAVRYGGVGEPGLVALLTRPIVLEYVKTLLLGGGWVALLAPFALLPALPSLLLNVLSSSDWMASGKAHYSALGLPFLVVGAAMGLSRLASRRTLFYGASAALVATSGAAYLTAGAGPFAANFAPATVTQHAVRAAAVADSLPLDAAVSATSSLVPHLTRRARVYEFPAVRDADYIFLDVKASPAPTSAGDVFLRAQALLAEGGWNVDLAEDGLLLLHHVDGAPPTDAAPLGATLFPASGSNASPSSALTLVDAQLLSSTDATIDVDGPRGILHTTWRTPEVPLPPGSRLHFGLDLGTLGSRDVWDVASLWWNPPEAWPPDSTITIDVPDIPAYRLRSWQATSR
ncbi:MAG: DUF2079 domain-containing protein [Chloroflexi bacterium]|nr:DUF2079 domain-containing protein [Chloroflexota bacterium]